MTEVLFLSSLQAYQLERLEEIADRLRKDRPDLRVKVAGPEESGPLLAKYKLSPIADYPTGPGFVTKATAASVIDLAKQGKR